MRHNICVSNQTDAQRIQQRYPKPRTGRIAFIAVAVVIAVAGAVWLWWAAWTASHPAVSAQIVSFTVESDTHVNAQLQIERPDPSVAATCKLIAQSPSYERVGEIAVEITAASDSRSEQKVAFRTFKRATSVSLEGCQAS